MKTACVWHFVNRVWLNFLRTVRAVACIICFVVLNAEFSKFKSYIHYPCGFELNTQSRAWCSNFGVLYRANFVEIDSGTAGTFRALTTISGPFPDYPVQLQTFNTRLIWICRSKAHSQEGIIIELEENYFCADARQVRTQNGYMTLTHAQLAQSVWMV
jgi:hypothetical protein